MFTTRIAPSPTGLFHLGTARTAYFSWLAARASGGRFVLRIDDTDEARNTDEAVQVILESMSWLGLDYDEIYYQSKRAPLYREAADKLIDAGRARVLGNGAVVLNLPELPDFFIDSIAGKIPISKTAKESMDPLILIRGDGGGVTYQFASTLDDYFMGINWIIRGHDHIQNTPKQMAIWMAACGGEFPKVSHVGLIFKDGKKMTKRDGAASLLGYRQIGYAPEAMLTFMLRLGWSPFDDSSKAMNFINRETALKMFLTDGGMRAASRTNFDERRLNNIQANYEREHKIPRDQWVSQRRKTE